MVNAVALIPMPDPPPSLQQPANRPRPSGQDGPALEIRAAKDDSGLWRVEAFDSETGAVVTRPSVTPQSRIGRALEALAAELASRPRPRR
jgi:hypothetical protein